MGVAPAPTDKLEIGYQFADTRSGEKPEGFLYPQHEDTPGGKMSLATDVADV